MRGSYNQCILDFTKFEFSGKEFPARFVVLSWLRRNKKSVRFHFQVIPGSHYPGSFIGEATESDRWVANKVDDWVHSIKKFACLP